MLNRVKYATVPHDYCLTLCKLENIFGNCVSFVKDEIKSMYSKLKCCVKFDGHFSNFFTSNIGLMPGDLCRLCYILFMSMIWR
jgi:hypothetical protein